MEPKFFASAAEFRSWLKENHTTAEELWVGYYKKDAEQTGIGYGESVEEAICFGWIDGLIKGIDDKTYKRRFTPRKPDSKWSKANKERVETMVKADKMTPAGMELVEAAKESGEWEEAYRVGDDHEIPPELKNALQQNEAAWKNFSNTNQHAYITLVTEAKTTETKETRIEKIVELAEKDLPPYDEERKRRI